MYIAYSAKQIRKDINVMRFMIVDDDKAVRCMLKDIIEDCKLGEVVDCGSK